ncbi:malonate--CoA ligase-like [Vigna radiata var. radiata]|uniref:Malonate--CoA ligase-like n=1 Tax=Vigna radiata var. radiata TaxID=3916 RepID=A0A3Q0EZT8_VIGRR|nr:malonate--CoA ligase-like [Vigna radiata var. radiata]
MPASSESSHVATSKSPIQEQASGTKERKRKLKEKLPNQPPPQSRSRANQPPPSLESHHPYEELSSLHPVPPQCRLIAGVKKGNPRRRRFAIVFSPPNPSCRRRSKTKSSRCLQFSQPPSTAAVSPEYLDKKISTNLSMWEKLPRNAMGKVNKKELKKLVVSEQ